MGQKQLNEKQMNAFFKEATGGNDAATFVEKQLIKVEPEPHKAETFQQDFDNITREFVAKYGREPTQKEATFISNKLSQLYGYDKKDITLKVQESRVKGDSTLPQYGYGTQ